MPPHIIEPSEVQAAYAAISGFFDTFTLLEARRELRQMLTTAGACRYWKGNPSNVLFFYNRLDALITAVLTIHRFGHRRINAIIAQPGSTPVMTEYAHYCGWYRKGNPWYFFPRRLSRKEYGDPYKVFAAIASMGDRKDGGIS